jgi:hypothetical protein
MGDMTRAHYILVENSEEKYLETQPCVEDNTELQLYDMRMWTCLILCRVASMLGFI